MRAVSGKKGFFWTRNGPNSLPCSRPACVSGTRTVAGEKEFFWTKFSNEGHATCVHQRNAHCQWQKGIFWIKFSNEEHATCAHQLNARCHRRKGFFSDQVLERRARDLRASAECALSETKRDFFGPEMGRLRRHVRDLRAPAECALSATKRKLFGSSSRTKSAGSARTS